MRLEIHKPYKTYLLSDVSEDQTINSLRSSLRANDGVTSGDISVIFAGDVNDSVANNDRSPTQHTLIFNILKDEGLQMTVAASPLDTVGKVKQQIGVGPDCSLLLYGRQLHDATTLTECDIVDGITLRLAARRPGTFPIIVWTPNWKMIELYVLPSDTVGMVKKMLAQKHNVPVEQQLLIFDGRYLKFNDSLARSGVQARASLRLMQRHWTLFVRNGDDLTVEVRVSPHGTIDELKQNIEEVEGTPADFQCLLFNGKLLNKGRAIVNSIISNYATLDLMHCRREDTNIIVQTSQGIHRLDIPPEASVDFMKRVLEEREGIRTDQFRLMAKGKFLDEQRVVGAYLKDGILTARLVPRPQECIVLLVRCRGGKHLELEVSAKDSISDVKQRISDLYDIPVNRQRLLKDGNKLDHNKFVTDYQIQSSMAIQLEEKTQDGPSVRFLSGDLAFQDFDLTLTLQQLKNRIQENMGLPSEQQALVYNGWVLLDEYRPLSEYHIRGPIFLIPLPFHDALLVLRTKPGIKIYNIASTQTIHNMTELVTRKIGIPKDRQRLLFSNISFKNALPLVGQSMRASCPPTNVSLSKNSSFTTLTSRTSNNEHLNRSKTQSLRRYSNSMKHIPSSMAPRTESLRVRSRSDYDIKQKRRKCVIM